MGLKDLEKALNRQVDSRIDLGEGAKNLPSARSLLSAERTQQLLFFCIALLFGPVLTYILTHSHGWQLTTKLNVASVIYISGLIIFYNVYNFIFNYIIVSVLRFKSRPNLFVEFSKFFLTILSATQYNYIFIFEPLFHHQRPPHISMIFVSTALQSAVAATIFYRFRQMKDMALKSKVAQAEAQYSMLESQMQPHFLFNSLNVLSELIYVDPDLANSMTQKIADLYREILNNSKAKFSTLESEISILQKYIEIQKIRFGNRISFRVEVSPAFLNIQIPSLMLQTLVENAIKHGISPMKDGGDILLSVKKVGKMFEVCISNTGKLYKGHTESKRSTGLANTMNRLDLTYGSKNSFRIYSDDQRTYVKFLITGRTT